MRELVTPTLEQTKRDIMRAAFSPHFDGYSFGPSEMFSYLENRDYILRRHLIVRAIHELVNEGVLKFDEDSFLVPVKREV